MRILLIVFDREHLTRRHPSQPGCNRCNRCRNFFENEEDLDAHLQLGKTEMCEVLKEPFQLTSGMTPQKAKQLKDRKKRKGEKKKSEEEQAQEIYRLLFPNDELPECFCEFFP